MSLQSEYEFSKARLVIAEDEQDAMQDAFHDEVSDLFRGARECCRKSPTKYRKQ